ncbi:MAG: D-Ala-D-Ala carboxypeptidase family metallohydrolase [Pseudomonadota bacterium]
MKLSTHFTLDELTVTDHRELDNTPPPAVIENLRRLAALLEQVKLACGGKPVLVSSGYRSRAVNLAVGSKESSQHRLGCAADFRILGMTADQVVRRIISAGLPFDQVIREFDRWTHISVASNPGAAPRGSKLIIDRNGNRGFV